MSEAAIGLLRHRGARVREGVVWAASIVTGMLWLVGAGLAIDTFALRYIRDFTWVTPTGKCAATRMPEPMISQARVRTFAGDAAVSFFSFDYFNFQPVLVSALRQFATPAGRERISAELDRNGMLREIRNRRAESIAVVRSPPNISEEGRTNGRYYWRVEVPIRVFYRANVDTIVDDRMLIMTVVRIKPSAENPSGIGVDGFIARSDNSGESLR